MAFRPVSFLRSACARHFGPASRLAWALVVGLGAAAAIAPGAHAQAIEAPTAGASAAVPAAPAPRYTAGDLERAFGFMDSNRDGKVSREEASGFRGVAKNFDRADTSRDGILTIEEFGAAMNHVKPQ